MSESEKSPMRAAFEAWFINPFEQKDEAYWEDWQAAWKAALANAAIERHAAIAEQAAQEPMPGEDGYVCPAGKARAAYLATTAPAQHDREADRQRFPDPDFNRWLDEGVSDYHTVWDAVGDIAAAWAGWDNRPYYE